MIVNEIALRAQEFTDAAITNQNKKEEGRARTVLQLYLRALPCGPPLRIAT